MLIKFNHFYGNHTKFLTPILSIVTSTDRVFHFPEFICKNPVRLPLEDVETQNK